MTRQRIAAAGLAAGLGVSLCMGLAVAGQPPQKSIRDGVFTAAQVEEGAKVYEGICGQCHAGDLFGPEYMEGWDGATVAEFYELIQGTMPYENPGSLEDKDYANVLVFLFSINGVEPGEEELPTDVQQLYDISIDGPFKWNGSPR